jgi:hypothetical protein
MQTQPSVNRRTSLPVLSQTQNNTTLWIGHLETDQFDHFAGQTFQCPSDGLLNNIQIYSSVVHQPGDMGLTIHEFDNTSKTWGPALGEAVYTLQKGDDDARWIRFNLEPVSLKKDNMYGFRLKTTNALIGIGEAAGHARKPFDFGHEWNADSRNERGYYLTYFSLMFKVELCA